MTREEAIQEFQNVKDLIKQDGKDWFDERDLGIIDMAIEALKEYDELFSRYIEAQHIIDYYDLDGDDKAVGFERVVRCKDCRWYKQINPKSKHGMCRYEIVVRTSADDDYCSYGERAEQTKYPATYNIDPKCWGCVHLDEFGRCLSFMTAKDDRSCWQGSWSDEPLFNDITEEVGRPHGEWIDVDNEPYCECSVCGAYIDNLDDDYEFCPRCGADMRGDNNE